LLAIAALIAFPTQPAVYSRKDGYNKCAILLIFSLKYLQMCQTPLHVAAGYNNTEIVKFLLNWQGTEMVDLEAKNMVLKCVLCHTSFTQ